MSDGICPPAMLTRWVMSLKLLIVDVSWSELVVYRWTPEVIKFRWHLTLTFDLENHFRIFICPIAIAYSMGQIIKLVCVCLSVYLSVCEHSHGRISWSIFTKIGTDVRTPRRKNKFVRGQYRTIPSSILSPKTSILGQEVLKTHTNIK